MTDTSSTTGATPAADSGATPTTAPGSATPPAASLTLEEALKRIAELEHSHGNAREELERHRKKVSAYEKVEAERDAQRKAAEDAQLSENERLKKQHAEAEQQAQKFKQELISAKVTLAAQAKGIIDPDLAALAIQSSLEYGDDGMPTNVDKALDSLLKSKPYLAPKPAAEPPAEQPAQPPAPAQTATTQKPPAVPPMAGRTAIPSPAGTPPGKIPTWNDIYGRK